MITNPFLTKINSKNVWTDRELIQFARKYSWAVPTNEAISLLGQYSPIVEIGAGSGYWAKLLSYAGTDIVAYDKRPFKNYYVSGKWFDVLTGTPQKLRHHPSHTLFLCMPVDGFGKECLKYYTGEFILYITATQLKDNCDDNLMAVFFQSVVWNYQLPSLFNDISVKLYCCRQ